MHIPRDLDGAAIKEYLVSVSGDRSEISHGGKGKKLTSHSSHGWMSYARDCFISEMLEY